MSDEIRFPSVNLSVTTEAPTVEKELYRAIGGKDYYQPFTRNDATTLDHCIAIATAVAVKESTTEKKVEAETVLARLFIAAYDLSLRPPLAAKLEAQVEGPGKQIDKAAKALSVALGISEAEARDQVVAGRTSRGLPV